MKLTDRGLPLGKAWTLNLGLSVVLHLLLTVISVLGGSLVVFSVAYVLTAVSILVLLDWELLTLFLSVVSQLFAFISLFYLCYSPKLRRSMFKGLWQGRVVKSLFPIVSLHSLCICLLLIFLKRKYGVEDFPMKDVVTLLKDCDEYFSETRRRREKMLEDKKLAQQAREIELRKQEEVAKKIVDGLYGFSNRSGFPELETKDIVGLSTRRSENKAFSGSRGFDFRISIPDDLETLRSVSSQNNSRTNRNPN